ncbi:metallopeptidase TldD-related protein [Qipengyuania sp. G39]|uniref:Metallopeptidase TldD-related protein n=1 Tax=Qipengyuania profundimaris TaxID=3067652 RepID=A0ABT9HK88_9SPHN|nr:metallopeptidase TldD-related protein [Qipengyuania sp. G39]MDP4573566.1 metallopeptidase TldD-related protein [Qipengyuania sp. G39]
MIDSAAAVARCQELVDLARARGADAADAACRAGASESVSVRLGELEEVERSESEEISLRVFVGRRSSSIQTSDFAPEGLAILAKRAVEMARLAPEDPYGALAPEDRLFSGEAADLELLDPDDPSPEELRAAALAAEDAARAVNGVTNSNGSSAGASRSVFGLATSNGFARGYASGSHTLSASVVAGEGGGMETDYAYRTQRFRSDLPGADEIGREAGERAVRKTGSTSMPSRKMPVVFEPRVGNGVLGHLLAAMSGPAIARKSSFLIGREGEQLFDSGIRVREEPFRKRGLRSRYFDGEGVPCSERLLVEDGKIGGWLTNVASANQLDLDLTGHAGRGGGGAPGVSASNIVLDPGTVSVEELIADIEDGLYVTGLFGQGVNLVTGDYSRGASGFRIRGGEIAGPVSEITIAGTLPDMFRALTPANDLELQRGIDVPTFRIDGMAVAGE